MICAKQEKDGIMWGGGVLTCVIAFQFQQGYRAGSPSTISLSQQTKHHQKL